MRGSLRRFRWGWRRRGERGRLRWSERIASCFRREVMKSMILLSSHI